MAYRFEKEENGTALVMDGFEQGIADSPYLGIGDMRNANIISVPKEASVGFAPTAIALPPTVTSLAFSVATTDIFTVASTSGWYNGMAIVLNTLTGGNGLSTNTVYYVGDLTATTFKVYPGYALVTPVDVTVSGTGTLSSYTFGTPAYRTIDPVGKSEYIADNTGKVWLFNNTRGSTTIIFAGNTTISQPFGIAIWKDYLFLFRSTAIDYVNTGTLGVTAASWQYAWKNNLSAANADADHSALAAQDDALYFCNVTSGVGSLLEVAGQDFDPTNAATYTYNISALAIPSTDRPTSLGELGTNLLVGGLQNFIYPWDRISPSYNYPLVLAESNTKRIVTTNSNAYLFTGNRGRIYITNGSGVELYKKIPDSLSGTSDPYFTWGDAVYWKNQIYFSFTVSTNAGVNLSNTGGVWAIDVTTEALRYAVLPSFGAYTGSTPVIVQNVVTSTPGGSGLYIGWINGSGTGGIDITSSTPYTNYQTYIQFDLIPVGTYLDSRTFKQIEFKLSKPLVSGESIKLSWRTNLTDSFTLFSNGSSASGIFSTVGIISGYAVANFEKCQWLQIQAEMSSTATNPSYTKLREVRIR